MLLFCNKTNTRFARGKFVPGENFRTTSKRPGYASRRAVLAVDSRGKHDQHADDGHDDQALNEDKTLGGLS